VKSAREAPVWVVAVADASADSEEALRAKGVVVLCGEGTNGVVDLSAALKAIAARGITRLMVEGGPTLAAALLAAGLVDEVYLFHAPTVVGAEGIDAFDKTAAAALARQLNQVSSEPAGLDRLDYYERR
jgi:diaminohydroxyphosphoribosylaminopyrimidine deaminase / 5-amino-6-(5-phosphoribosylamino)uracil reductase